MPIQFDLHVCQSLKLEVFFTIVVTLQSYNFDEMLLFRATSVIVCRKASNCSLTRLTNSYMVPRICFSTFDDGDNEEENEVEPVGVAAEVEDTVEFVMNSKIHKIAFMQRMVRATKMPAKDIELVLEQFKRIVKEEVMLNNNTIIMKGFGTFKPKKFFKLDPTTGKMIENPEERNIGFHHPTRRSKEYLLKKKALETADEAANSLSNDSASSI